MFASMVVLMMMLTLFYIVFFFNATAPTEIYTLSLHDALPIFEPVGGVVADRGVGEIAPQLVIVAADAVVLMRGDRKSTRLNSSHRTISYAVFCLKKKKRKVHTRSHSPQNH